MTNTRRFCSVVSVALVLSSCASPELSSTRSQRLAVTFPSDWVAVKQGGARLMDAPGDGLNNGREIVGPTDPAAYIAASDTTFMVRLRLDTSPLNGQDLRPYSWGLLFETDADDTSYEYLLVADATGATGELRFLENTTKTGGVADDCETELYSEQIDTGNGGNVQVTVAGSNNNSDADYFLDMGVPLSVLNAEGISLSSVFRLIVGTSSSGESLSLDIGGTSSAPDTGTLAIALSDWTYLNGKPGDVDGDGVANPTDIDNDNDGVPDVKESELNVEPDADADNDGIPNWRDKSNTGAGASSGCVDTGLDGVCDSLDSVFDWDGDQVPNHNDLDSDNDAVVDTIEAGHGKTSSASLGLTSGVVGANGLSNMVEMSADSGVLNYVLLDTDGDATPDLRDRDADGDTLYDITEIYYLGLDVNTDGIIDNPEDQDEDGLCDVADDDMTQFGTPAMNLDWIPDDDSDGIPNVFDYDSTPGDANGNDSDNDTLSDTAECPSGWPCPANSNGRPDYMFVDNDLDGVANAQDSDPDDPNMCLDNDNDGCDDCSQTGADQSGGDPSNDGADVDSDGACDVADPDADGDGVTDDVDTNDNDTNVCRDVDSDGCDDCAIVHTGGGNTTNDGLDSDNDGICDVGESDVDGDSIVDLNDADTDGDGIPNALEGSSDSDSDSVPNEQDLDSDGDGLLDTLEAGFAALDTDYDGRLDDQSDADDDGLATSVDVDDSDAQVITLTSAAPNSDNTGTLDFLDLDSDDDGIEDRVEGFDHDADGAADVNPTSADLDDDGVDDAYNTWYGANQAAALPNVDNDLLPDYRDADDDGDGTDTADECADPNACTDVDGDEHPDYLDAVSNPAEAGVADAALPDVAASDAGAGEAGIVVDAGTTDNGVVDAGLIDAASTTDTSSQGGSVSLIVTDAGSDSGTDAGFPVADASLPNPPDAALTDASVEPDAAHTDTSVEQDASQTDTSVQDASVTGMSLDLDASPTGASAETDADADVATSSASVETDADADVATSSASASTVTSTVQSSSTTTSTDTSASSAATSTTPQTSTQSTASTSTSVTSPGTASGTTSTDETPDTTSALPTDTLDAGAPVGDASDAYVPTDSPECGESGGECSTSVTATTATTSTAALTSTAHTTSAVQTSTASPTSATVSSQPTSPVTTDAADDSVTTGEETTTEPDVETPTLADEDAGAEHPAASSGRPEDAGVPDDPTRPVACDPSIEDCKDSDGDGVPDVIECPPGSDDCVDTDGDGEPDYLDQDDDNDGIPTSKESMTRDLDQDGIPDALDPDKVGFAGGAGCAVQPQGSPSNLWLAALALAVALALYRRRVVAAVGTTVASLVLCGVNPKHAQAQMSSFQLDRYRPAPTYEDGFAANRAVTLKHGSLSGGLQLVYTRDPLVLESPVGSVDNERFSVVSDELQGHLGAAYGLHSRVTGFVGVPVVMVLSGKRVEGLPQPRGATLGNPLLGARVMFLGDPETRVHLALQLGADLPLASWVSDEQSFVGSKGLTFSPQLIGDFETQVIIWSLSLGARLTTDPTTMLDLTLANEATAVLGAALPLSDRWSVYAEVLASTFLDHAFSRAGMALEGLLGLKTRPMSQIVIGGAVGTGLSRGIGEPDLRAILSGTYVYDAATPPAVVPVAPPPVPVDTDEDGLLDRDDRCPSQPENVNGLEDADGCPDSQDADNDGILDANDTCVTTAEDRDAFLDEDGCPEPDNDGDSVLDAVDECPVQAGVVELLGCPVTDSDGDTVSDSQDACPQIPGSVEDKGCKNSTPVVQVSGDRLDLSDRIYFEAGKDVLLAVSHPLLETVANVLSEHPEYSTIIVEGHTDDVGSIPANLALSQKRAEAVVNFLVTRGVAAQRMSARGYGESRPIVDNATEDARAANRRVEFKLLTARGASVP